MGQHCFFCESTLSGTILLNPEESRHAAKVLRLEPGDEITLLNGQGSVAEAAVAAVSRRGDEVSCEIRSITQHSRPRPAVRLYVAPPRAKLMGQLIRSAVELGVASIQPILCRYGVSKPDGNKEAWKQDAIVACKQSRNPWMPELQAPVEFAAALASSSALHFLGAVPRPDYQKTGIPADLAEASLWIGPEGGFAPEEEEALFAKGAIPLTIGPCILRVETAVPALLGALYGFFTSHKTL